MQDYWPLYRDLFLILYLFVLFLFFWSLYRDLKGANQTSCAQNPVWDQSGARDGRGVGTKTSDHNRLPSEDPAALEAKNKITNRFLLGTGPESSQNPRSPKENDSPDPPPDPPGGRGDKNKIKNVLKYSWEDDRQMYR